MTSIASGVTCFGSAVSFRANNFTEKVNSALAEKSTNPAAFNTTQSGEASGSLTGIVTTTEGSSNGTDITSTATLASQTDSAAGAGQSSSSVSTGAGAFITQAPILLVGGAAVMVGFM